MPAIGRLTTGVVYIRSIGGTLTFSSGGVLSLADGTAAAPSLTFSTDTDAGLFLAGAGLIAVTVGGSEVGWAFTSGTNRLRSTTSLSWSAGNPAVDPSDLSIFRDAANILAQRNGANAQTLRAYATFTDASNYERFAVVTTAGGANITLAAQTAGTGVDNIGLTLTPAGTGTVNTVASFVSSGATAGIGYATGAGGTVTQATDKATGVTLNTVTGEITMNAAALAGDTTVTFTLTNSAIATTDLVIITHDSAGTAGSYTVTAQGAAGSAAISVRNITTGSLSEAIVLKFVVFKAVNA